jgi:peptidoglycan hydrolase-like protein with peptidoglycan-binding domain
MRRYILTPTVIAVALLTAPFFAHAAELSLSPASGTHTVGTTFTVNILLDTDGSGIDGVDINQLNFNPNLLEVVDADTDAGGIQIDSGDLMTLTSVNSVDTNAGTITFSQLTGGGSTYSNTGPEILATITFRVKASGSNTVMFDFTPGSTADTNVAADGADILTNVGNGTYTLQSSGGSSGGSSSGGGGGSSSSSSGGGSSSGSSGGSSGGGGRTAPSTQVTLNTSSPLTLAVPFFTNLFVGIEHSDVRRLQQLLNQNNATRLSLSGSGSPGLETSYYGPITADAVRRFQCLHAIVCSGTPEATGYGVVGSQTRSKLNELYTTGAVAPSIPVTVPATPPSAVSSGRIFTAVLTVGVSGSQVTSLQSYLANDPSLYPEGLVTGYFGDLTMRAVERFQCRYGIVCSGTPETTGYGVVGPQTRSKLNEVFAGQSIAVPVTIPTPSPVPVPTPPAFTESSERAIERETVPPSPAPTPVTSTAGVLFDRTLVVGDSGDDVRTLQAMLAQDSGVYPEGYVTGYFSRTTELAVRRFQSKYGVVSSGTPSTTGYGAVGPSTQEKLLEVFGN